MLRLALSLLLLVTLSACAGTSTQYSKADSQTVAEEASRQEALAKADSIPVNYKPTKLTNENYRPEDRLAVIAGRVFTAAAPYCDPRLDRSFLLAARALADEQPMVSAPIAVKAPGEKDNIYFGDRIVALNGQAIGRGAGGIKQLAGILDGATQANQPVNFTVERKGQTLDVALKPVVKCAFGIAVQPSNEVNAYADGKNVIFTTKIMDMLTDDELAFVVGHELAHNIFEHVSKTQGNVAAGALGGTLLDILASSQGVNTGGRLGNLGGQIGMMKYSQDFEREADYVGMYITELAGFAPEAAVGVVEKFSKLNPKSIRYASTHPANAERGANARLTLDEIRRKKANNQPLVPTAKPRKE